MYVDLFDHKGPILFFIQALGILINENIGIFILQIINYYITVIFLDKLINLFEKEKIKKYVILAITLIVYGMLYEEGNLSEEWTIGMTTISLYIICKGLLENGFKKTDYLINGVIFALISLIRINNAATIVGFCIYEFFSLLINKNYKELKKLILWFILGMLIIYIPIIIIFYKWNALYEMIYATFVFNFIYGTNSESLSIGYILLKLLNIIPLMILFVEIYKNSKYKKNIKRFFYTIIIVNAIGVSVGYAYIHYYIVLIPLMAILLTQLDFNLKNITIDKSYKMIIVISVLICYISCIIIQLNDYTKNINSTYISKNECIEIKSHIEDENSVLCYNLSARVYLILDIMPCYKYASYQIWHAYNSEKVKNEIINYIKDGNIRYIITSTSLETEILEDYSLIYETRSLSLWELN